MHTRNAPFALFLRAGPSAKDVGERQIPMPYRGVFSPHSTRLFRPLNGTEELGPWATSGATPSALEMH